MNEDPLLSGSGRGCSNQRVDDIKVDNVYAKNVCCMVVFTLVDEVMVQFELNGNGSTVQMLSIVLELEENHILVVAR